MSPKRKDKDIEISRNSRMEAQSDNELFLQAFEKPTQIYRYLRTRNIFAPLFLHRNLTYMKDRMSRSHKNRANFKVDSLMTIVSNKNKNMFWPDDYMSLMFIGLYDKLFDGMGESVTVETIILKISPKKRKDSPLTSKQIIGTSIVRINPTDSQSKIPTINLATDTLKSLHGSANCSYNLILNVTISKSSIEQIEEPTVKRIKLEKMYSSELVIYEKQRCVFTEGEYQILLKEFSSNTKIGSPKKMWIDDNNDLERSDISFKNFNQGPMLKFYLTWSKEASPPLVDYPFPISTRNDDNLSNKENHQDLLNNNNTNNNNNSNNNNNNNINNIDDHTNNINNNNNNNDNSSSNNNNNTNNNNNNNSNNNNINNNHNNNFNSNNNNNNNTENDSNNASTKCLNKNERNDEDLNGNSDKILYQFIYNNDSCQQTECGYNYHCPWCSLNCKILYSLLKHLKLSHARFNFTYVPSEHYTRIDVSINELYDGSYTGSPHDLVGSASFAFSRGGPVRRTSVTRILVCRPRRLKPSLTEFQEIDDNELNSQRPYITGHNRLYYHTMTCLPVHPKELDVDSEGENDPVWLQHKTMNMIDEFTDVNEGEKELMKMWNLHIMRNGYVGDIQIPMACDRFLDMKGKEILQKNLYRNFVIHMCNLFDFGLITPDVLNNTIQKLQKLLSVNADCMNTISEFRKEQLEFWEKTGKHIEQKARDNKIQYSTPTKTTQKSKKDVKDMKIKRKDDNSERKSIKNAGESTSKVNMSVKRSKLLDNDSISNNKFTVGKRKSSCLRESPPRRRSAGHSSQQINNNSSKILPNNRRNSLTSVGSITSRKRMSLTLTKVDK